jgi:uncharacterized protein (DUF2267 family)
MSRTRFDAFGHATATAHRWLSQVATTLGTEDRQFAYRALRAWLHTLRDRLTVESAVDFAAQLPELLRGAFYDGWEPTKVPLKYDIDGYLLHFAWQARIPEPDAPSAAARISDAMRALLAPGELDSTLALLPASLRELLDSAAIPSRPPRPTEPGQEDTAAIEGELADLHARVDTLTSAVRTLAQGLEDNPLTGADEHRRARAARLASEILMTNA